MLGESEAITERSQWKKVKVLFDRDLRYKAVEGSSKREELFKEYIKSLGDQTEVRNMLLSILCLFPLSYLSPFFPPPGRRS